MKRLYIYNSQHFAMDQKSRVWEAQSWKPNWMQPEKVGAR